MINVQAFVGGIAHLPTGVWGAPRALQVSYPADGNEQCAQLEVGSFWFAHRNRCIVTAVRAHPPAGFILDVGGGNGFVTRGLIDAGFSSVLLEPGEEGVATARQRRIDHIIHASLEEVQLVANSIPAVGHL